MSIVLSELPKLSAVMGELLDINHTQRAFFAWPVLTAMAGKADYKITYGDLAAQIGIHHRAVRYVLGVIQDYCLSEKLPPLTILVVNKADGLPGDGFIAWDASNLTEGISQVCSFNWNQLDNPFSYAAKGETEDELAERLANHPSRAKEVYTLVKVRGVAQSIFRKALLIVYRGRCAFCGMSFERALQAAHLIPWSKASFAQRMSINNGILLCATHHCMFDAGLITLSPNHLVEFDDPDSDDREYLGADKFLSLNLHGKKAFLPESRVHQPSAEFLAKNHGFLGWDFS